MNKRGIKGQRLRETKEQDIFLDKKQNFINIKTENIKEDKKSSMVRKKYNIKA